MSPFFSMPMGKCGSWNISQILLHQSRSSLSGSLLMKDYLFRCFWVCLLSHSSALQAAADLECANCSSAARAPHESGLQPDPYPWSAGDGSPSASGMGTPFSSQPWALHNTTGPKRQEIGLRPSVCPLTAMTFQLGGVCGHQLFSQGASSLVSAASGQLCNHQLWCSHLPELFEFILG